MQVSNAYMMETETWNGREGLGNDERKGRDPNVVMVLGGVGEAVHGQAKGAYHHDDAAGLDDSMRYVPLAGQILRHTLQTSERTLLG